jgi:hypothetical protein
MQNPVLAQKKVAPCNRTAFPISEVAILQLMPTLLGAVQTIKLLVVSVIGSVKTDCLTA